MLPVMCGMGQAVSDQGRRGPHHVLFEKRGELAAPDMQPVIPAEIARSWKTGSDAP